jgi:hypothetical protein
VFVAVIETRYPFVALGATREEAEYLVAEAALEWLTAGGDSPWWDDRNTVQDVIDYFSPCVTRVEPGTAVMEGTE